MSLTETVKYKYEISPSDYSDGDISSIIELFDYSLFVVLEMTGTVKTVGADFAFWQSYGFNQGFYGIEF